MATFLHRGRELHLDRMPLRADDPLRAWDAADEYLLRRLEELEAAQPSLRQRILIFGDAFGALGCALAERCPVSWNDSHLARLALDHNLQRNGLPPGAVRFVPGDRDPGPEDGAPFDAVLMKYPRSLAWWEDALRRLRPLVHAGTVILGGGMIRHTPRRIHELMQEILGPTETSLGWRKARLAQSRFEPDRALRRPRPGVEYEVPGFELVLGSAANSFSRGTLDAGAELLLQALPTRQEALAAADLGCGNGVLALALARRCPRARILAVDESYQAVACARANAVRAGLVARDGEPGVVAVVGDGLAGCPDASLDLVICNPPFHQGRAEGDQIAWGMFRQAQCALKSGGELLVVGNRHLGYHVKLARLFDRCETVASDRRFVVLRAR